MSTATDLANLDATALLAETNFAVTLPDFSSSNYQIPVEDQNSPIYAAITKLTNADLTAGTNSVTGTGIFDLLMQAMKAHLRAEFDSNRISGAEYTKAYIACVESAAANATQFLVNRDSAYWSAVTAQIAAQTAKIGVVTARVQLESAKAQVQILRIQSFNEQAQYALNKLRLATEDIGYTTAKYNLDNIVPKQGVLLDKQASQADAQTANITKQTSQIDKEILLYPAKQQLIQEQIETARAQTLDTRSDGSPVTGSTGKQKDLYTQQITSYKRDSEQKGVKIFTDAWVTMKTIDEGLAPPTLFSNANLDAVLTTLKQNLNL